MTLIDTTSLFAVHDAELSYDTDSIASRTASSDNPFTRAIATFIDEDGEPMYTLPV